MMAVTSTGLALIIVVGLAFGMAARQSFLGAAIGTDHTVHTFLIRAIQANRNRLFVRIPRLLNDAVCAALPLYLHWCLAQVRPAVMFWAERLLNPVVNALHVLLIAYFITVAYPNTLLNSLTIPIIVALFAFTPQFFHALSARNFGLSTRGIGLLLLSVMLFSAFQIEYAHDIWPLYAVLGFSSYLIWAFSTFGAQALVIISLLLAIITGRYTPIAGAALGLLLFIAVHPRYSIGYLRGTLAFLRDFANELAPAYILNRRYSVWRDLVKDIWLECIKKPIAGVRYAYENPVLIVLLLNPLVILAVGLRVTEHMLDAPLTKFAADVVLCGVVAMLATSFRKTRFLGEPERYVEAVTGWAVLAAAPFLIIHIGLAGTAAITFLFLIMCVVQLKASAFLVRQVGSKAIDLAAAERAIKEAFVEPIRCCSNNEQLTKMLMANDWDFSYCIAVGRRYCGMRISEAFSAFPFLKREALERIIQTYRINVCVLDRSRYDSVFISLPPTLRQVAVIHETHGLRVLRLDWRHAASGHEAPLNLT
ncbi:hypothetical protein [Allosphingosinicella vermicomposti]|uniref:hypothetical protein n=1 Tax=Allosphingosinicella vermicomposti TaxID=614671 RepID=UPI000D0F871D|nr:hypothetical protein [Allosphingosinicella vermicomposti]